MKGKLLLPIFLLLFITASWAGNKYFLDYDGSDDYVKLNDNSTLDRLNSKSDYTLECWVYIKNWHDNMAIYSRWSRFIFYLRQNGQLALFVETSDGWKRNYSVNNAVPTNEWAHVAAIRTSSGGIKFYVNGVDKSAGTFSGYSMLGNSDDDNLYIAYAGNLSGTSQDGDVNFVNFDGYIDEVRLKDVAEDPNDLHYHKNDPEYVSDGNTAALFHFDEGNGSVTYDEASGNDARLGDSGEGDAAEPTWRVWNYNGSDLSLPVELNSFSAIANPFSVLLRWSTASEVENLGFIVQRSMEKDGPFQTLASYQTNPSLKGAGNSSKGHEYSYEDHTVQTGQTYWYRLQDVSMTGEKQNHGPIQVNVSAQSKDLQPVGSVTLPKQFKLYPNFPNPFNPETQVTFDIPQTKDGALNVKAVIYDINGKQVGTLYQGAINPGQYRLKWDGTNDAGHPLPSGIYIMNVKAGQFGNSIKMTLMR